MIIQILIYLYKNFINIKYTNKIMLFNYNVENFNNYSRSYFNN